MRIYIFLLSCLFVTGCMNRPVSQLKNKPFNTQHRLKLDVFSPHKTKQPKPVLLFVHGGNWEKGDKSIYTFFGKGMAKKGIVTVVIDYRLSPLANYIGMAMDVAEAVKWVKDSISRYGGDTSKIFISGHSAGGHLAALIATDNSYFDSLQMSNPLKGVIVNDGFGLDMYSYLTRISDPYKTYLDVFSKDPQNWTNGSPINHLRKDIPAFLIFLGGKTYPDITTDTKLFYEELKKYQPETRLIFHKRKTHKVMIGQFYLPYVKAYRQVISFIKK